jgi:outer membrane biosynthesis protein TonB
MSDLVSSAIGARTHEDGGIRNMLLVSVAVHVAGIALLMFLPHLVGLGAKEPDVVMSISLGPPGPPSGGMTGLSSRAVQQATPTPELPRPQPVRPPAAKTPEMSEPTTKTAPRPPVTRAPREAVSRTPTTGAQEAPGRSQVDTKVPPSMEAGLSTGGINGTGGQVNTANFCDPQWLGQVVTQIQRNWQSRQQTAASSEIHFTIQRDGALTDISVRRSAGQFLDLLASRAVQLTRAVPPIPACYPYPTLVVNLSFDYIR